MFQEFNGEEVQKGEKVTHELFSLIYLLKSFFLTRIAESVQAHLLKFPNLSSMLAVYTPDNHP